MLRSLINVSGDALDYGGHVLLSGLVKIFKFLILYMFSKMSTFEMKKKSIWGVLVIILLQVKRLSYALG